MNAMLAEIVDAAPKLPTSVRWVGVLVIAIAGIFLASAAVWVAMRINHADGEIDTTEPEEPA